MKTADICTYEEVIFQTFVSSDLMNNIINELYSSCLLIQWVGIGKLVMKHIIDIEIINKKDGVVRGILTILRAIKIGHKIYSSHKIKLVLFKFFTLLVGI